MTGHPTRRPDAWPRAVHESGHALVAARLLGRGAVARIELLEHGVDGGRTTLAVADRGAPTIRDLRALAQVGYAGLAAERLLLGEDCVTSGSTADVARVTELLVYVVSTLGTVADDPPLAIGRAVLDTTASPAQWAAIRAEAHRAYAAARRLIDAEAAQVHRLAEALVDRPDHVLGGQRLSALLGGHAAAPRGRIRSTTSGVAVE